MLQKCNIFYSRVKQSLTKKGVLKMRKILSRLKSLSPFLVAVAIIGMVPLFIAGTNTTEVRFDTVSKQCTQYVDFQQAYITGTLATTIKSQASAALSASTLKAAQIANGSYVQDQASFTAGQKAVVVGNTGTLKGGTYTVTSDDDTANTKTIATGLSTISSANVQVLRTNVAMYSETITYSAGNITVADNGATYVLTTGDVINWIAVGGL
jgi:hypothetical protein